MRNWKRSVLAIVLSLALCVSSYGAAGAEAAISAASGTSGASGAFGTFGASGTSGTSEAEPPVEEGSLLVTFEEDVTEKKAEAAADKVDGQLVGGIDGAMEIAIIEIDEKDDADRAMKKLERLPQVEAVQPNFIYFADEDGSEEDGDADAPGSSGGSAASEYDMWHMEYMRVQEAWDLIDRIKPVSERTAEDKIKVATLDSGIWNHVDMQENVDWENCVTVIGSEQPADPEDGLTGTEDGSSGSDGSDGDSGTAGSDGNSSGTALLAEEDADGTETPEGAGATENPDSSGATEEPVLPEGPETPLPPWMAENLEFSRYDQPAAQHGTTVAGLIAATSYNGLGTAGIAAGNHNDLIELMGIKVFKNGAYSGQAKATTVDIVMGLRYACQKEARVINMCLGHEPGAVDGAGGYHDDALLKAEIDRAVEEDDVVITCSAGNKNDSRTWYPSDLENVISVINTKRYTDAWSKSVRSSTSSYGYAKDVSAPGTGVYAVEGMDGYKTSSGTSCATANAAGVAALVRYANPDLAAWQVKKILYETATDLYENGYDIYTGYGNLNAYKAVAAAAEVELPESTEKLEQGTTMTDTRSVGKNDIEVTWKKEKSAAGYYLYRSASKDGRYELIEHFTDNGVTSYIDYAMKNNRNYYYRIATLGTSLTTKEKIQSELSEPIVGKAVTEIPKFGVSRVDSHSLNISWKRAEGAHGYRVFRARTKDGTYSKVKTIEGGKASGWTDSSCTPGKKYYYKVRAYRNVDDGRVWGDISGHEYKTAQPVQVKDFKVAKMAKKGKDARKARLSWRKDSTVSGYEIYCSMSNSGAWKRVKTIKKNTIGTYTTEKLKKNRVYSYKVRSYVIVKGEKVYGAFSPARNYMR